MFPFALTVRYGCAPWKAAPFDRSPYVIHIQTNAASTSQIAPKSASDNNTTTISGAVRLILIGR